MRFALTIAAASIILAAPAAAQQYTAIVLPLPGGAPWSVGSGAANGVFGGTSVAPAGSAGSDDRAILWIGGVVTDVTPPGFFAARITNSRDGQHVGATGGFAPYAFLWTNAGQRIPLHPGWPYTTSDALGVGGGKQVGYARMDFYCSGCGLLVHQHAGMWTGSASSFTRLHAPDYYHTAALDTTGTHSVGWGLSVHAEELHALMWDGTGHAISLHPGARGFTSSQATCVRSGQQGGSGVAPNGWNHALLWSGSAESAIDLHPMWWNPTISWSGINALGPGFQVGGGYNGYNNQGRAYLWHGSPESILDLHAFLPPGFQAGGSAANDVDPSGTIIGTCTEDASGLPRAVIWVARAPASAPYRR